MKVRDVSKLSPEARFLYWIEERHRVWEAKKYQHPKPWTNDEILQSYFFTSPYRENDKTTIWFREKIRNPLRESARVIFATACFRWFNFIPTGRTLIKYGLLDEWDVHTARRVLGQQGKIFTGAFMINSPPGETKLNAITRRVNNVYKDRWRLIQKANTWATLQQAHEDLSVYEGLGGFMAYEIVCDLRYTKWLEKATDKMRWCNPGPGCIRGLYRITGREIKNKSNATSPKRYAGWEDDMNRLLKLARAKLPRMPPFEMREIEHSLCEWDKYERARLVDGKLKRRYQGV